MKIYIVFLAMLLAGITALSYNSDMMKFVYEENLLKAVAEECASGAAMLQNEDAYSEGQTVFEEAEGLEYAQNHINYALSKKNGVKSFEVSLEFEDDEKGYSEKNSMLIPTVTATVTMKCEDIFRLPFITVSEVTRTSAYELKERDAD
ncbi:MAG: hypothetical protein K6F52_01485 [Clostridia bacterium]|nr:hypothetical protein [Clostridia bacterium]